MSTQQNRYLLVIQDYFTKWAEAIPIPNQTATCITQEVVQVFSRFGLPAILHSVQGANFESTKLSQTLEAFGVRKSCTTSYHPQGDGMVERFNRTLLQMLRTYTQQQSDWEQHLSLVLLAYRSATHPSTGLSPFELMFGRSATHADLPELLAFEPMSCQADVRKRLAEFYELVETHHTQAAQHQKSNYNRHTQARKFAEVISCGCHAPQPRSLMHDGREDGRLPRRSTRVLIHLRSRVPRERKLYMAIDCDIVCNLTRVGLS